jgi:hypothetical protein
MPVRGVAGVCRRRALRVGGVHLEGTDNDFRNNVFYNWLGTAGTGAAAQPSQNNFINNFYLAGYGGDNPVGGTSTAITTSAGGRSIFNGDDTTVTKAFQRQPRGHQPRR